MLEYSIIFHALSTTGQCFGTFEFDLSSRWEFDLEHKQLALQRFCVEYARLIGCSCSVAEIVEIELKR